MKTNANKIKILLVDDDRLVLVTLAQGLVEKGLIVHTAESVDDAEAILSGGNPVDLAVIDVQMPERDGFELAERLRLFYHVPFIFLSAFSDQYLVEKALEYGALSYQVKPIEPVQLAPVLEASLARAGELELLKNSERCLQSALNKEREVSVAIGITMIQYRLGRKAAFELLRNSARSQRCKLSDIAANVVETAEKLIFDVTKPR